MGMTPLEGLVMGTRAGDLDPGVMDYLAHKEGMSLHEIDGLLNKQSGLLGLSGLTNDMRELIEEEREHQDRRSKLAIDIFCNRAKKYIGAYMAEMGGGSRNPLNNSTVFMLLGTVLGGALSGWLNGRMKLEIRKGPHISVNTRLVLAFSGGLIMAYGARLARGCTSGQALTGGAVLSAGSFAFMFAVFGGAYGLAWFLRRVWN